MSTWVALLTFNMAAVEESDWPGCLLPPSETGEERVLSVLRGFQHRRPELRVDELRLRFAYTLKPEQVLVGQNEFDGYFAFVFCGGAKVLLDNPIEGNAAIYSVADGGFCPSSLNRNCSRIIAATWCGSSTHRDGNRILNVRCKVGE
jgi:hypothetical protein